MSNQAPIVLNKEVAVDDELSPRWLKFFELYRQTGNATQSAIAAGFSETYAQNIRHRFPDKVRKSLASALEDRGVTSETLAERVEWLIKQNNYKAVSSGIQHAARMGLGGGYVPERTENKNLNVNVDMTPSGINLEEMAQKVAEQLKQQKTNGAE